jgi:LysM repeat protein
MGLFDNLWSTSKYGSLSKNEEEEKNKKSSVPLLEEVGHSYESNGDSSKSKLVHKRSYDFDEKPDFTQEYEVKANDNLVNIAARFWTTPTFVKKLNKLPTHHVFVGQILLVPKLENKQNNKVREN